jgi:hypothetical protein
MLPWSIKVKRSKLQNGYNLFVQERYQMAFLFTSDAFSSEQKMGGCDMYHSSKHFPLSEWYKQNNLIFPIHTIYKMSHTWNEIQHPLQLHSSLRIRKSEHFCGPMNPTIRIGRPSSRDSEQSHSHIKSQYPFSRNPAFLETTDGFSPRKCARPS